MVPALPGNRPGTALSGFSLRPPPRLTEDDAGASSTKSGCHCKPHPNKPCDCDKYLDNLALKPDQKRARELTLKIQRDEDDLDAQQQWLDDAAVQRKKLVRMMDAVNASRGDVAEELNDLRDQKELLKKKLKRDALERDLKVAHDSLNALAAKRTALQEQKDTVKDATDRVADKMDRVNTALAQSIGTFQTLAATTGSLPPSSESASPTESSSAAAASASAAASVTSGAGSQASSLSSSLASAILKKLQSSMESSESASS